jgi:hypothetical protein
VSNGFLSGVLLLEKELIDLSQRPVCKGCSLDKDFISDCAGSIDNVAAPGWRCTH